MLTNELQKIGISKYLKDLLSAWRLSGSREFSTRRDCQSVVENLLKRVNVNAFDMCLTNGDNFGMVVKGEEASYKQRTLFQDIIIRMSRLIKLRIHHENVSERLSRRPTNDWLELCREDLIEMETAQQTVAVTDDDFSVLTRVPCYAPSTVSFVRKDWRL